MYKVEASVNVPKPRIVSPIEKDYDSMGSFLFCLKDIFLPYKSSGEYKESVGFYKE